MPAARATAITIRTARGRRLAALTPLSQQYASAGFTWSSTFNGVFYQASNTHLTDITRGSSNTFILGEKFLNPQNYYNGSDGGDNEAPYVGFDNDITRTTFEPPQQDNPVTADALKFGSAHSAGLNMALCDGSVSFFLYTVDPNVWLQMGAIQE